jgi:hypothetical protein
VTGIKIIFHNYIKMTKSESRTKSERSVRRSLKKIKTDRKKNSNVSNDEIDLNEPVENDLDRIIAREQLLSILRGAKPNYEAATGKSSGGRRKTRKHRRKTRKQ